MPHFGMLILSKARIPKEGSLTRIKLCARKDCKEEILPGQDYFGLVSKGRNGVRFTRRCHPECFIEYVIDSRAIRSGLQDERRAQGLTSKGGRPRMAIDDEAKKVRRRLQIYCYKDQNGLAMALLLNNPKTISNKAIKLAHRLRELADPRFGVNTNIKLQPELLNAIHNHLGGDMCREKGWINKFIKNATGGWDELAEKSWYPRDPNIIAGMLERDFITGVVENTTEIILNTKETKTMTSKWVPTEEEENAYTEMQEREKARVRTAHIAGLKKQGLEFKTMLDSGMSRQAAWEAQHHVSIAPRASTDGGLDDNEDSDE